MKITKRLILISIISLFVFAGQFIIPQSVPEVKASSLWGQQVGLGGDDKSVAQVFGEGTPADPRVLAARIIKIFLGFMGIVFLVLIVWAGYNWMTAAGNEEKITKAKDVLTAAVIGLIIILAAYAITDYITDCVLDITSGNTVWMCR